MADPEPTPTPTPDPTPTPSWRDTLPEDVRNDPSLKDFKDAGGLAKSYIATKAMVGTKSAIPGPDAKPEEIAAYRKAIGVPDAPTGYKVKAHEIMAHPEWNRGAQDEFVKAAHAAGFTPDQVNTAIGFYADFVAKSAKDNQTAEAEAKVALRNDWGVNYDTFLGASNRGISRMERAMGMEPGTLVEAVKGSNPEAIARLFHHIESTFVEHGFVTGEPVAGLGREEAQAKLGTLQAELLKVPPGSDRASEIINEIIKYDQAARRAA